MRPATVGGLAALASLPVHLLVPHGASVTLAALVLAAVAAIYVGFALVDARRKVVVTEIAVASVFLAAAAGGVWLTQWLIPVAYVGHAGWDVAHHRGVHTAMPRWYIPFCAVFDVVFAVGLTAIWRR